MFECIEFGWWDDDFIKCDYFIVVGEKGECYWVYCECVFVSKINVVDEDVCWYLYGLFG